MTGNTQPEALRLAQELDEVPETGGDPDSIQECAAELRRQHTRIAELEAQLESIGAGGVNGPLMGQPQAMPDLSQLTERGAKAWAGVDAQGLREGGADMSKERDDLTAFYAWLHTYESEVGALDDGSARVGFIAGRASLQPPGFTAADMATVSAQGFRDGVASLSANAGEPTCDMRTVVAVAVTMLYDTHPEDVCRVFDRNDLETIVSITEPLGHGRVEDIYRDAWDHVAAPPTAQAEGWRSIETAPKDGKFLVRDGVWYGEGAPESKLSDVALVQRENGGAFDVSDTNYYSAYIFNPTGWMPLPPTSAEGVEHG